MNMNQASRLTPKSNKDVFSLYPILRPPNFRCRLCHTQVETVQRDITAYYRCSNIKCARHTNITLVDIDEYPMSWVEYYISKEQQTWLNFLKNSKKNKRQMWRK